MSDQTATRNYRKVREGIVTSDKMNETVVVTVQDRVKHKLYGKFVTRSNKLHAHNADDDARVGDRVRIVETRPISKTKHWRVAEIVERAK